MSGRGILSGHGHVRAQRAKMVTTRTRLCPCQGQAAELSLIVEFFDKLEERLNVANSENKREKAWTMAWRG